MKPRTAAPSRLVAAALGLFVGLLTACSRPEHHQDVPETPPGAAVEEYDDPAAKQLEPPDFSSPDVFPCSGCHDASLAPNPERRVLSMAHEDVVLKHDEKHRWCLDCHDKDNRDRLRLASGTLVPFEESYRLCGQCHGDKYRDWRAGVHGRRTGMWNGEKEYLLCVHCHNSHAPRFKPLKPLPPPRRPGRN